MEKYQRITALHRLFKASRHPVSVSRLLDELACSRATLYRDLAFMRDTLMAPLEGDGEKGFFYDPAQTGRFELPGLWLSPQELHALLAAQHLLADTEAGVLSGALAPLRQRIEELLARHNGGKPWPLHRVRMISHHSRHQQAVSFPAVAQAVLERRQLQFEYLARSTNARTQRHVSPQRIAHYRDNWYLDAWDHQREALRSFSVDRISQAKLLEATARDIDDAALDAHLAASYGIFSGAPKQWATIVFSQKSARWVADERWHSQQKGRFLDDGRYELQLPYSNGRELLMDILQYGADAQILAPVSLREQARTLLDLARANYD